MELRSCGWMHLPTQSKEPGEKNFLNEPGTWDLLEKVRKLADKYNLTFPEIHASYGEKNYEQIAERLYDV